MSKEEYEFFLRVIQQTNKIKTPKLQQIEEWPQHRNTERLDGVNPKVHPFCYLVSGNKKRIPTEQLKKITNTKFSKGVFDSPTIYSSVNCGSESRFIY